MQQEHHECGKDEECVNGWHTLQVWAGNAVEDKEGRELDTRRAQDIAPVYNLHTDETKRLILHDPS